MKKLLALLTFLLFLLLVWFSWNWYVKTVACCEKAKTVEVVKDPLYYDCNSKLPIVSKDWPSKMETIVSGIKEGKKLLIVGPYFNGENESLGMARAEEVKKLFLDKFKDDDIVIHSRKVDLDCKDALKDQYHYTLFQPVVRNEHVVEYHDKAYIYFKYDTTKEIDVKHVVDYLNNLVADLKTNQKTVTLTGHTDHDGNEDYNYKLGLKRAERVKSYLVNHGISADRIVVKSKGKTEPISTNATPEGRQLNRRVEIVVN